MNNVKGLAFVFSLLCSTLPASVGVANAGSLGALETLRESNEAVRGLLRTNQGSAQPSSHSRQRVKSIVNGFLDYEELARRSLGEHWDKMKPSERAEFVYTFRSLIERNYVKQLKNNVDYQIDYKREEKNGNEATVYSIVEAMRKGRSAETTIDYRLSLKSGHWMVYDVITDDVSLLRNYRSQFARIISRDGYPALIAKMKRKLAEMTD